jgi:hypothetical protein
MFEVYFAKTTSLEYNIISLGDDLYYSLILDTPPGIRIERVSKSNREKYSLQDRKFYPDLLSDHLKHVFIEVLLDTRYLEGRGLRDIFNAMKWD